MGIIFRTASDSPEAVVRVDRYGDVPPEMSSVFGAHWLTDVRTTKHQSPGALLMSLR